MSAKLDRSRDFGMIFGDEEGRRFVQDGKYFDHTETLIEEIPVIKRGPGRPPKTDTFVVD